MSHRYRAYPTEVQAQVFARHCGDARWVWNQALAAVKAHAEDPTARFFCLTTARREIGWLAEGSSTVQQQALRDLAQALRNAKGGSHRFPRWRRRGEGDGFCVRDVAVHKLNRTWAEVTVPKAGRLRFRLSRPLPKSYGMARVTRDTTGRWHVSFAAPQPPVERVPTGAVVGIDRGVAATLATSDGELLRGPKLRPRERRRIERLQRQLVRQKKGSVRRRRTKDQIARAHAKAVRRRNDWIEKRTTELVRSYDLVAVEDLKVPQMTRTPKPKPDPDRPGAFLPNGARSKAGLNRAILDQGWGRFLRRLEDKAAASGVIVVRVDPAYTSQTCAHCGHVARESRESQAAFSCVACGHKANADINAARNILARGLALVPTPGQGARPGDRPARTSPADDAGSENSRRQVAA
ncbi:MAG: transposase [Actinomycetota bacterium]|jgi:transposase|nr:transposase [Actinomycetota bacterium]